MADEMSSDLNLETRALKALINQIYQKGLSQSDLKTIAVTLDVPYALAAKALHMIEQQSSYSEFKADKVWEQFDKRPAEAPTPHLPDPALHPLFAEQKTPEPVMEMEVTTGDAQELSETLQGPLEKEQKEAVRYQLKSQEEMEVEQHLQPPWALDSKARDIKLKHRQKMQKRFFELDGVWDPEPK